MKEKLKKIIRKLPFDFNRSQKYDKMTMKIMKIVLEPDSTFVDIGCHKGEFLQEALRFAPEGKHYAFEPIPELNLQLQKRLGKYCEISSFGLSNRRGSSSFQYVKSNPSFSGIKQRTYPKQEQVEEITIKIDLLDNQLTNAKRIDLIKIDVEGAELEVLEGSTYTIAKHLPVIIFEHVKEAAEAYEVDADKSFDFFESVNYNLYTLKSFVEDPTPLNRSEFLKLFESGNETYFAARFKS